MDTCTMRAMSVVRVRQVTFEHKDNVKQHGAKFDGFAKKWCTGGSTDHERRSPPHFGQSKEQLRNYL